MPQPTDISRDKAALRTRLRERRKNLPPEERKHLSDAAAGYILASAAWQKATCVALYIAVRGETETLRLLDAAWRSGKEVLLPLCSQDSRGCMDFVACPGEEFLLPGAYGIPEPSPCPSTSSAATPPGLIIVPGVAFDRTGARLGQGGGYYDRLLGLPPFVASLRIGSAYAFQIVDRLPSDPWDLPMHAICTEQGLSWIAQP